jgi:hypothetical protein
VRGTAGSDDPSALAQAAEGLGIDPASLQQLFTRATADLADSFATVFIVATVLVACCLVPAAFLPRRKVAPVDPTAMMGH